MTCSPSSTPTRPGTWPPCCTPNATWSAPGLAADDGDATAAASFTAAIVSLREQSTPYHLAHGLLDHAEYLMAAGSAANARDAGSAANARDAGAAENAALAASAIAEACDIAGRLRCQPLLDRADALTPRDSATAAPQDSPRVAR